MAKAKKGDRLSCEVCGLVVSVDEACGGCETAAIVCCAKPMVKKRAVAAKKPKAKAVKAKATAKPAKAVAKKPAKAAAKAKPAAKKPARAKK
jgi:hypothetical protein